MQAALGWIGGRPGNILCFEKATLVLVMWSCLRPQMYYILDVLFPFPYAVPTPITIVTKSRIYEACKRLEYNKLAKQV